MMVVRKLSEEDGEARSAHVGLTLSFLAKRTRTVILSEAKNPVVSATAILKARGFFVAASRPPLRMTA
jgi:hypothetical protein